MSEQDNRLPPGWDRSTLVAGGVLGLGVQQYLDLREHELAALLRKAYEQGQREVEEAVGAGGVQSPIQLHCRHAWVDATGQSGKGRHECCLRCSAIRAVHPEGAQP